MAHLRVGRDLARLGYAANLNDIRLRDIDSSSIDEASEIEFVGFSLEAGNRNSRTSCKRGAALNIFWLGGFLEPANTELFEFSGISHSSLGIERGGCIAH